VKRKAEFDVAKYQRLNLVIYVWYFILI